MIQYDKQHNGIQYRQYITETGKVQIRTKLDNGIATDGTGNSEWIAGFTQPDGDKFIALDRGKDEIGKFDTIEAAEIACVEWISGIQPEWFKYAEVK